ncbi:AraC family transcriptional regulator [Actinomadura sp. GC306]|uniref:helix-turn-helix domain-containing protein n=1 Tax=Actinomadura sp. GC306 TaxID=2530367 RepID=UPI00105051DB|nr:AraC family transcriptional regulator [Actinomadura sp. GC306]TDC69710.1 AraC family transcriptional regulator [Actinomadura sp. GC306]
MKKNGQPRPADIPRIPYRPAAGIPPGLEVLDFRGLIQRARGHRVDIYAPRRPAFHEFITVRNGTVRCTTDLTEHRVPAGGWFWMRPGQIHRYIGGLAEAEGTVVLFTPDFPDAATRRIVGLDRRVHHRPVTPAGVQKAALDGALRLLEEEHGRLGDLPLESHIDVLRHLLAVILLRLTHLNGGPGDHAADSEVFLRFQQAVGEDYATSHRVADYAARLGYSVRTLTRATRTAAGCGAKRFIDDRILLEAKRLLSHTDLPPSAVGDRLGFTRPTAFSAFFQQRTGLCPTAFRARSRGTDPSGGR